VEDQEFIELYIYFYI